jgi:hypothetical protein
MEKKEKEDNSEWKKEIKKDLKDLKEIVSEREKIEKKIEWEKINLLLKR